ncbi:MAG: glycosyltransferase family 2 protein [Chloroflexi bacterium]|nr:glycosyltransferase family 2 protein [Chloroflexota bacterium]
MNNTAKTMKLSIIIVSWNTKGLLADCLASVYKHPPVYDFEVWVVDNASDDGSAQMVERDFPQVQLIRNRKNLGFARANNMAMQVSDGRYILLLNPDTVVKPGALSALVQFMDDNPQAGGAGSLLLNPDETLQPSCHPLPTLSRELWRLFHLDKLHPYGVYHMADWDTAVPHQADIIQGASFILRREALVEVGLLDDSYFMYSEEVDLCYRLKKAGWPLYWVPQSRVIHYGGQSTKLVASDMFIELYRGKLHYFRKNYGPATAFGYKIILATATLPRLTLFGLAFLQKPPKRDEQISLAQNYGRLITTLPTM